MTLNIFTLVPASTPLQISQLQLCLGSSNYMLVFHTLATAVYSWFSIDWRHKLNFPNIMCFVISILNLVSWLSQSGRAKH